LISSSLVDDLYLGRKYINRNEIALQLNVKYFCLILGFCREVDENCAALGYYATSSGNYLPTLWDNLSAPFSGYPAYGTDRLSRNVGKKLPLLFAF
jgi:hypothetical protein